MNDNPHQQCEPIRQIALRHYKDGTWHKIAVTVVYYSPFTRAGSWEVNLGGYHMDCTRVYLGIFDGKVLFHPGAEENWSPNSLAKMLLFMRDLEDFYRTLGERNSYWTNT
jgi:hypothetical protein